MRWGVDGVLGALVVVVGVGLVAAGVLWRGRAVRPFAASRARAAEHRAYTRALLRAADQVIAAARRSAGDGEPAVVTVDAVERLVRERYGYAEVERRHAAAALRRRYERGRCAVDCVTDAYG
ncbi:hypothetical protein [Streptomyces sp. NPDC058855]|uniref:hypothetical protein n=1 Tax=Streptomyces sp. NPDC058855 TaxID=3346651 RepID=UPI0036862521